jgi:uncharacterized protein (UPF0371 family)
MGMVDPQTVERIELLMKELDARPEDRPPVLPARQAAELAQGATNKGHAGVLCGAAIQLPNSSVVTGINSPLMHAASSAVLNAIKSLAGIPAKLDLLSPMIIQSIATLKQDIMQRKTVSLDLEETLIALSIAATASPTAELAVAQLSQLRRCEMHMTHIPTPGDDTGLRRLGLNLTCDPHFSTSSLFVV